MTAIKLSKDIIRQAKIRSRILNCSVSSQIEHWIKIGKLAEENPDLNYSFIKTILNSREEALAGKFELCK